MRPIETLLVPTDFSACSAAALEHAAVIARATGAAIELLHVIDLKPLVLVDVAGYVPAFEITQLEEVSRRTTEAWTQRAELAGLRVQAQVVTGIPEQAIVERASACKADMIVLGTHGRRGFQHFMLGSVAERVARMSTIPVLTVRERSPAT